MMDSLDSLKLPQLREKCVGYGLKKSENKAKLINRIKTFEEKLNAENEIKIAEEIQKK